MRRSNLIEFDREKLGYQRKKGDLVVVWHCNTLLAFM